MYFYVPAIDYEAVKDKVEEPSIQTEDSESLL
jgi:hypothetical protein